MNKVIRNTTEVSIKLKSVGVTIQPLSSHEIDTTEYGMWASDELLETITPYVESGAIIASSDGVDLSKTSALKHLERVGGLILDQSTIEAKSFSYHNIEEDKSINIPENQQMKVDDGIEISGQLEINGSLVLE